ncbi:MAG: EamA family transporter, partial [Deltaproteobacteria bacterium]|nr:EamA family transporter [Deltaproteobacteria bacterium]
SLKTGSGPLAVLAVLGTAMIWSIGANYTRRRMAGIDPMVVTAGSLAAASLSLLPLAWATWPTTPPSTRAWLEMAFLGIASSGIGMWMYFRLLGRIGAVRAMSYHSLVAAALLAPLALLAPAGGGLGDITGGDLALLVAGAATIGMVSGIAFVHGLVRIGAARAAVLTFAEPLVAVAVGALVWEEPLHPIAALGGALVLGAGIHVAREAR